MGCNNSIPLPPIPILSVVSAPVSCLSDQTPSKPTPVKLKKPRTPIKTVEDYFIVWLNSTADSKLDTQEILEELQKLVKVVLTFTDLEECHDFIDGVKDEKIFLIVTGTLAEQFAETVQEAPQIDSIYCLSLDEEASKIQISSNPRVVGVFTSASPLCEQVKTDVKICGHNLVKPVVIESDAERIRFMYDQLFREIILTSKEEDLEELYQFCENNYSNNEDEMRFLAELRTTYSKDDSILWYSKQSCLYKILNRALRTHEYETLYILRIFIRHLHEQIVVQPKVTNKTIPTLYRGQVIEIAEFDRMNRNRGRPAFFPNFLSTSADRQAAMKFIQAPVKSPYDTRKIRVLFEIKVNKNVYFPFADLSKLSGYKNEGEWLFSMGSVFRINTIEEQLDGIQLIRLTSINDNDKQLKTLKEYIQNFVKDENICLSFARLMHQLADWKGSRKFYEKSLDKESEPHRKAAIHNDLGSIALELEEHDKALKNYQQALELDQEDENSDRKDLASTYNNIGTLYYEKKEMDLAIDNFRKAIEAYNAAPNGNQEVIATLYNNIANVLNHQGKHQEALVNNERCVRIREKILPPLHPSLAIAYNSIANTYYHLHLFSQGKEPTSQVNEYAQKAVDYAGKAVNIDKQALPPDHPQTKTHLDNLKRFMRE